MNDPQLTQRVPVEQVGRLIHLVRGEKGLLDADLARLYSVETRALNQAVKRNPGRFPADFMFQLTAEEAASLRQSRSQSVTLNGRGRNLKYLPSAFTEQGVAMLSSVLRSERAVLVNVALTRACVSLCCMLAGNEAPVRKLAELERKIGGHTGAGRRRSGTSEVRTGGMRATRFLPPSGDEPPRLAFTC